VKKGDTERCWVSCRVEMISGNGKSLALSADEGLPLCLIDRDTGRQTMLLLLDGGSWVDVVNGAPYEVRHIGGRPSSITSYVIGETDGREWITCLVCTKTSRGNARNTIPPRRSGYELHPFAAPGESIEQIRAITSKVPDAGGWMVTFECGHTAWWAIEPSTPASNCAVCFDRVVTAIRARARV
jgi:hypothetical protein